MTDKQIIDKEKDLETPCPYHCSDKIGQCVNRSKDTPNIYCINNKDCIYKQYGRKEQENKRLKQQIDCKCFDPKSNNNRCISYNRIAEDYEKDLKQLNQLKKENKELHSLIDLIKTDLMKSDMENDDLIVQNDKLKEENEKLKKEIKDLIEKPEIQDKILWKIEDKKITEGLNLRIYVLEQALKEIKEIAMDETYVGFWDEQISSILKKINECEGGDGN